MTVWQHTRRGRIEGELLRQDDTWMHIRLTADSPRASALHRGHGPVDEAGETITVRATHVTEITPRPTVAQLLAFATMNTTPARTPRTPTWPSAATSASHPPDTSSC